jgi:adenine-specific DNA-methyltransferase
MVEKLDRSFNISEDTLKQLKKLIPEAFKDGLVDIGALSEALPGYSGEDLDIDDNLFGLYWPGKRQAKRAAAIPPVGTLVPVPGDGVDEESTKNIYIEGENLEVLKIIRKAYLGKIKMIYIDPPYNTGNDFIYPDDFSETEESYKRRTGQIDENGVKMTTNSKSDGRFHSNWCSMMYPRLRLARDLLTDDGVIFISINDSEVHSLRNICDETFGVMNFIATLIWDRNHSAQAGIYKVYHEYILVYCKNIDVHGTPLSLNNDLFEAGAMKKESGRHSMQQFTFPKDTRFEAKDGTSFSGEWGDVEKVKLIKGRMIAKNNKLLEDITLEAAYTQITQMNQFFHGDKENLVDSRGQKIIEFYLNSSGKVKVVKQRGVEAPQTTCKFGPQGTASIELAKLFEITEAPFASPKPINMIVDFATRFTSEEDIILDFFSGSSTTAHAIMELNSKINTSEKRKFILIQIPDSLDDSLRRAQKDAKRTLEVAINYLDKQGLPHLLTEIGKERIRRAGKKIKEEAGLNAKTLDTGFRVFRLAPSNFKPVVPYTGTNIKELPDWFSGDPLVEDWKPENLITEVMLKEGFPLDSAITKLDVYKKNKVYQVSSDSCDHSLIICLDVHIENDTIEKLDIGELDIFICLDSAITDQAKARLDDKGRIVVI